MSLVNLMKEKIFVYYEKLKKIDQFHCNLLSGSMTPGCLDSFLSNIHYLLLHTPVHLKLAISEAEKHRAPRLMKFYEQKLMEESGHDKWAEADLLEIRAISKSSAKQRAHCIEMGRWVKNNERMIKKDPHLFLAYIFFAEYITVICGPDFISGLEKSGLPRNSLTCVENHATLDKEHINEWEQVIGDLVDEAEYEKKFLTVLDQVFALHADFYASLQKELPHAA